MVEGTGIRVELSLNEIEDIQGYVAAEANHTRSPMGVASCNYTVAQVVESLALESVTDGCHPVVEIFSKWSPAMATVNFSVPADVKEAFDKAFRRQNKSAVLADLMRQAVEERRRRQRRAKIVEQLLALRKRRRRVTDKTIRAARRRGRP